MIDQMFKTILRGFRNFYRKLYKVYQSQQQNEEDKHQTLVRFIRDLGLYKLINEQKELKQYCDLIGLEDENHYDSDHDFDVP